MSYHGSCEDLYVNCLATPIYEYFPVAYFFKAALKIITSQLLVSLKISLPNWELSYAIIINQRSSLIPIKQFIFVVMLTLSL